MAKKERSLNFLRPIAFFKVSAGDSKESESNRLFSIFMILYITKPTKQLANYSSEEKQKKNEEISS
jgi:hypothetical protein